MTQHKARILAAVAFAVFSTFAFAETVKLTLSGATEVPPVQTMASGTGSITVNPDMTVSGMVTTTGLDATAAHIHFGGAGKNGPVVVGLDKGADGSWSVPPGTKLTADQYKAFKAGELYVNVHTAANKAGEIRGQLMP